MKIYFASPSGNDINLLKIVGAENFLFSYHYLKKMEEKKLKELLRNCGEIFLDSGAFSAKSLGEEIDIENYMQFISKYKIKNYGLYFFSFNEFDLGGTTPFRDTNIFKIGNRDKNGWI